MAVSWGPSRAIRPVTVRARAISRLRSPRAMVVHRNAVGATGARADVGDVRERGRDHMAVSCRHGRTEASEEYLMIDAPFSPPSRRTLVGLVAGAGAAGLLPTGAWADSRSGAVAAVIDGMVREQGFQGVVMLGRGGRARTTHANGLAHIGKGIPMRADTRLGIASISKRLTAVAVMRLVEQGRLSLDTPITRWLPDYPAATGARITLRRLLSNSSGLPNPFRAAVEADPALLQEPWVSTAEAVRRLATGDLVFEPGSRFDYALSNWVLVLAILEAVTGRPYAEAMQTLVLDPLGMDHTAPVASPDVMSYRTVSPPVEWINPRPPFLAAAGGYYSTASDLLRFAHRVHDTDFLSRASRDALTTVEVASDNYALGGRMRTVVIGGVDVRCAWETGNTNGFRSVLGHRLDGRGTVVVLNNNAVSQRTMDEFAEALLRADAGAGS
ncbi:MAG: class A beta-lactamase-related serine hydrolase [Brevundimonas sp.]|nr:MAG: class A beta-lactamase-related serine hydrolase [Brevundimonas sp.]